MIKNSHEFEVTHRMIAGFQERLEKLSSHLPSTEAIDCEISAINIIIQDLSSQIKWYDNTLNREISFDVLNSLTDIPKVVTGKRLQLGLSQSALANSINLSEDAYLKLEDNDFYGISLDLLDVILSTLKIKNVGHVLESDYVSQINQIEDNMRLLKINKSFMSQLMPVSFELVKQAIKNKQSDAGFLFERFIEAFKKIFSFDLRTQASIETLPNSFAVAFKRRINANAGSLTFTSLYAVKAAHIIAKQMKFPSLKMRADPIEIHKNILRISNNISLESCLSYIWGLNIAVLPLDIKNGFHGACFDFEENKVIALNQQTKTISRWKFDLLHELYHALTMNYDAYIEREDILEQQSQDEIDASQFAYGVIFGFEVESFLKIVLERCEGKIPLIKDSIVSVANDYKLNIDDFSNYVAYMIGVQGLNLWGIAANLQVERRSPNEIARDILLKNINYSNFQEDDLFILQRALSERM